MVKSFSLYRSTWNRPLEQGNGDECQDNEGISEKRRDVTPFGDLHREMERLLEEAGKWHRPSGCSWERVWHPRCNVYECHDSMLVLVDLAGVRKEALDIRADVRTLFIRGEREAPIPVNAERCHHMEIPSGAFEREISLPGPVDPEHVTVTYKDGWLEIHLPKAERKRVEIE